MFDVGFAELFLLSLIGLLVLGPERLPAVAKTIGGFVRKARISYHNLKRTVEAELEAAEAANPLKEAQKELESVQREVKELGDRLNENQVPDLVPTAADPPRALTDDRDDSLSGEPEAPGDREASDAESMSAEAESESESDPVANEAPAPDPADEAESENENDAPVKPAKQSS